MILIRMLAAIMLLAVTALWTVQPVSACSCAFGDPRDRLERADAAFVGHVISIEQPEPVNGIWSSAALATYTFAIETVVKGDLGDQVEVLSAVSGASCGFEFFGQIDSRYGILLHVNETGAYTGGLCTTVDADILMDIAAPLPAPDGVGPAHFLVGGSFGNARVMALDSEGRTIAYGFGEGPTGAIAICPGGERAIEVYGEADEIMVGTRDLHTFEMISEINVLEDLKGVPLAQQSRLASSGIDVRYVTAATCADSSGSEAAFFTHSFGNNVVSALIKVQVGPDPETTLLWSGPSNGADMSPDGSTAYLVTGVDDSFFSNAIEYKVSSIDLQTGDITEINTLLRLENELVWSPVVSPDGKTLALFALQEMPPYGSRLVMIDLADDPGAVLETPFGQLNLGSRILWTDDQQLLVIYNNGESGPVLFDRSLNMVEQKPGFDYVIRPTLAGENLYGFTSTGFAAFALSSFDLTDGATGDLRKFDQNDVLTFVAFKDVIAVNTTQRAELDRVKEMKAEEPPTGVTPSELEPVTKVEVGESSTGETVSVSEPQPNNAEPNPNIGLVDTGSTRFLDHDVFRWTLISLAGLLIAASAYFASRTVTRGRHSHSDSP